MEINMINYMREIGMQHLTMSNDERREWETSLFLYVKIVPHVRRWRANFKAKKHRAKVDAILRGYIVRERINWVLDKPLELAKNPSFIILKE